jgi:hypothetical protein
LCVLYTPITVDGKTSSNREKRSLKLDAYSLKMLLSLRVLTSYSIKVPVPPIGIFFLPLMLGPGNRAGRLCFT